MSRLSKAMGWPAAALVAALVGLTACKDPLAPKAGAQTTPAAVASVARAPASDASPSWLEGDTAKAAAATLPADAPAPAPDPLAGETRQERVVQRSLPKAGDALWRVLHTTKVSEDSRTGFYMAVHPPQVRALNGKTLAVSGFMMPIEQAPETRHFLLSRYTPVCFFCPPGEPNEVIEVRTRKPLKAGYDLVKVTGVFGLADNGEKGLFFRLDGN